jgi:hypothetical protein
MSRSITLRCSNIRVHALFRPETYSLAIKGVKGAPTVRVHLHPVRIVSSS